MVDVLASLKKAGVPIGTIVDVGVNHSTPALIRAFPKHKHVLVEPISDYFAAIHRNYRGLDYQLIEAAANDADGKVYIESAARYGDGKVSHSHIADGPGPNRREVESLKVDTILSRLPGLKEPFFLKIDIEGAKICEAILRGSAETLKRTSVVMIEMTAPEVTDLTAALGTAGFQLFGLEDMAYYKGVFWQVDGIFVRKDIIAADPALRPMTIKPFEPQHFYGVKAPFMTRVRRRLKDELRKATAR